VVIAEIELNEGSRRLDFDPALTMLVGADGTHKATVANHGLRVSGTTIGRKDRSPRTHQENQ
jgi:predicted ATPase